MEYRRLGRAGVLVSPFCLGTMNFGSQCSDQVSLEIMDYAFECGINFFDTANVYGPQPGAGVTEEIVGKWLAQRPGRRESVILATKVFGKMGTGPNDRGLSAYHIRRACDESLRRLGTDHIDLYQMHHVERTTPWEEVWQAMDCLIKDGKIIYVGSSNFAGWDIATACHSASQHHLVGLVSEQSIYHLGNRMIELEVLPACRHLGLAVLPWSPLGGGLLGGNFCATEGGRRTSSNVRNRIEQRRHQLDCYEALCAELGERPATVALAWLLKVPGVTAPLIGPRTIEQAKNCLGALSMNLDHATLSRIDEIWPGPGGEAPAAYAW